MCGIQIRTSRVKTSELGFVHSLRRLLSSRLARFISCTSTQSRKETRSCAGADSNKGKKRAQRGEDQPRRKANRRYTDEVQKTVGFLGIALGRRALLPLGSPAEFCFGEKTWRAFCSAAKSLVARFAFQLRRRVRDADTQEEVTLLKVAPTARFAPAVEAVVARIMEVSGGSCSK
ncbi:hypothetical protein NFJ02_39g99130 [Pycnococcus provasolii]